MSTIQEKYLLLQESGFALGAPLTEETSVENGGSFQEYEMGRISYHPDIGAFEVHGAILEKYTELGAEFSEIGYPISDEIPTADGVGRMNDFEFGTIIWTLDEGVSVNISSEDNNSENIIEDSSPEEEIVN